MSDTDRLAAAEAAVAGLAAEVEALRRAVDPLRPLPGRVEHLARLLADLADDVAALTARAGTAVVPSWLALPTDEPAAAQVLGELCAWMRAVFLRYGDAAGVLPDCWLWHPDVVEELLWLMHAWLAAYQGPHASVSLVGDWHDRYRPGVIRRIRQGAAGRCSLEAHQHRDGRPELGVAPVVPGEQATAVIAAWWAGGRNQPPPQPTAEQLAAAARSNGWHR